MLFLFLLYAGMPRLSRAFLLFDKLCGVRRFDRVNLSLCNVIGNPRANDVRPYGFVCNVFLLQELFKDAVP